MQKMNLNLSWLALVIPLGIIIFVVFPEVSKQYDNFKKREADHYANIVRLDSLQTLSNPSSRDRVHIDSLTSSIKIQGRNLSNQRFNAYKIGGMLVVLVFMFGGMFGSGYWIRRKKQMAQQNRIEFNFGDFHADPLGQSLPWEPLQSGGSNFLSERLKKTTKGYKISSSSKVKFMAWGFFLVGLNWFVWGIIEWTQTRPSIGIMDVGKLFFTSGGPFILVGGFLVLGSGAKAYFHLRKRIMVVDTKRRSFSEAYALQVLQKFVEGNSSGGYHCYELNLITKTGERFNLLNHGDKDYLMSDMVRVSRFLKVPVWNRDVQ